MRSKVSHLIKGAINGARTRDPQLGKLMLYQLSYYRISPADPPDYGRNCFALQN